VSYTISRSEIARIRASKEPCFDDREPYRDPRGYPPDGFEYVAILTPYGTGGAITWYNGISEAVDVWGGILLPRNVCQDGTFYFFAPLDPAAQPEAPADRAETGEGERNGDGEWWCCGAPFGQHEPTCRNYQHETAQDGNTTTGDES